MQSQSSEFAISTSSLGKCYRVFETPRDRLKQALWRGRKQYYTEFWALRGASFEIKKGESVGIIGRNGSGKSTLLQLLSGTITPTEGSAHINGRVAALLELGSGFNPEFTGIENIFLNASLLGLSKRETEERIDDILGFADIGNFAYQPTKTYSSGMVVRLAFAVMAHVDPSILIVDEALSVGDAIFGQRCMRFIRRFTEQGTLLFVSHDSNAISSLCSRAIWIDSGKIRADSEILPILTEYTKYCFGASKSVTDGMHARDSDKSSKVDDTDTYTKDLSGFLRIKSQDSCPDDSEKLRHPLTDSKIADWNSDLDYGNRHAEIIHIELLDGRGEYTAMPRCGEMIQLRVSSRCMASINRFYIGYIVRDKLGTLLWGENNIGAPPASVEANDIVVTTFRFLMPFLSPGTYSISAAVSEGEPDAPIPMHYKPDALIFEPFLQGRIVHGVFAPANASVNLLINP
ncbi:MAG: ABC transporter ATP-binding protein [Prochlorococcaceae cyanobacterium]|jgi:lipopolysaccharide transport system ATP-binding protein